MAKTQKWRILNVDDDEAGLYATSKILKRAGFDVIEAANGTDALMMAATQHPDLVLLDVNLPDIGGFEVCKRLKQDKKTASIPVVHLSATFVHAQDRVQGLDGGADGYLVQPIEPEELVATIRSFLRIRKMEMALRESEERYRLLFNSIDEGFCIIEVIFDENEKPIDYRFLEINPSFEKQTGLIDAQGKRMRELAPKHEEYWFEIYGKIAITGKPARFVNRAEQLHRWYDVYAFRFGQPENRQVAILFNDITDRKRAESELISAQQQYRELFESVNIGILRSTPGPEGTLIEANPAALQIFEADSREQLLAVLPSDLYLDHDQRRKISNEILTKDVIKGMEVRYKTLKGRAIWGRITSNKKISLDGQTYFDNTIEDITERKQASDILALANRKLTLMNDVTYQDIQNKVTALRGYAELFKDAWNETERASFVGKAEKILVDIHQVIRNTKEYQEMGIDKARWMPAEHEIRIAAALTSHEPSLSIDTDLAGLELYTDPLIERIFFHLIDNAIKHGTGLSRISFSCHEIPDGLVLVCENDGAGIDPHKRATLFSRIVGDKPRFGLFFVSEYLTLAGMRIAETSEPGKGARFEITVPKGAYRFAGSDKN